MEGGQNQISFATKTIVGKDETNKIQQLIQYLFNTADSELFRVPVDWQSLNLLDYPVIIKNPMDLGTVRKKVTNNNYEFVEDCLQEILLIWSNAKQYNPKQHGIHKLADKLQKLTKKIIKNYLPFVKVEVNLQKKKQVKKEVKGNTKSANSKMQIAQPKNYLQKQEQAKNDIEVEQIPEDPPHLAERKNLLYYLHMCSGQQIGVVFLLIKNNCDEAIEYDEDENVNIRVQKIDDNLMKRLNNLLDMWGIGIKSIPTKKK